jgi:acyl-CoA thioester hydrolase
MKVEPEWIDYNGHLNMAYYNVLFDRAWTRLTSSWLRARLSERYATFHFTAEAHIRYLLEPARRRAGACDLQLPGFRCKAHARFRTAFHAEGGWLSATSENMVLQST